jgi:hypothetical protein
MSNATDTGMQPLIGTGEPVPIQRHTIRLRKVNVAAECSAIMRRA